MVCQERNVAVEVCKAKLATAETDPDHETSQVSYSNLTACRVDNRPDRFQKMSDRTEHTDQTRTLSERLTEATDFLCWRGSALLKIHCEMTLYTVMIQELRPRTIIETGCFSGASPFWLSDLCTMLLGEGYCKVISTDITLENVKPEVRANPNIEFIEASNATLIEKMTPEKFAALPRPLVFIEDAHYEFAELLESLHEVLQPGDYLFVEDTHKTINDVWTDKVWLEKNNKMSMLEECTMIGRKRDTIRELALKHEDKYRVDTHFQDMWGYNVGKMMNSIVKRVA